MGKDPAMLWYWSDWHSGTSLLSRFLKGCYMDVLHAQFNNGRLSLEEIKVCLGSDFGMSWPTLQKKFKQDQNGLFFSERLEREKEKRVAFSESRRQSRLKSDEDQVKIYLIHDTETGFYKIGSSVNPLRRFAEMCNQTNPAITVGENRMYNLDWVSEVCERSVENDLHLKFNKKRIKGEWFLLDDEDIGYIKSTYDRTYVKRTIQRTENENKNGFIDRGVKGGKVGWNSMPNLEDVHDLPESKILSIIELMQITRHYRVNTNQVTGMWKVFKVQYLTGNKFYQNVEEVQKHFTNWIKHQEFTKSESTTTAVKISLK